MFIICCLLSGIGVLFLTAPLPFWLKLFNVCKDSVRFRRWSVPLGSVIFHLVEFINRYIFFFFEVLQNPSYLARCPKRIQYRELCCRIVCPIKTVVVIYPIFLIHSCPEIYVVKHKCFLNTYVYGDTFTKVIFFYIFFHF